MTAETPTALFVCEDPPVEGLSGPATYNWTIINALTALGYTVDLIVTTPRLLSLRSRAAAIPGTRHVRYLHARIVGDRLRPTTMSARLRLIKHGLEERGLLSRAPAQTERARVGRAITPAECATIAALTSGKSYDLVAIDTIFRAAALDAVPRSAKSLLVAHDVFFERVESFRANGVAVDSVFDKAGEIAIWQRFDAIVAISAAEAATIRSLTSVPTAAVLPVVPGRRRAPNAATTDKHILYLGTAARHNVDGLRGFCERVWPIVRSMHPEAVLDVVGNINLAFRQSYDGVRFHGPVDDMGPIAAGALMAINPVWMGSGIKIKMVDYFRLGLPCIVTDIGAQGFPVDPPPPFVAVSDAAAFADAVAGWLCAPGQALAHAARIDAYFTNFTPEAATRSLAGLLAG